MNRGSQCFLKAVKGPVLLKWRMLNWFHSSVIHYAENSCAPALLLHERCVKMSEPERDAFCGSFPQNSRPHSHFFPPSRTEKAMCSIQTASPVCQGLGAVVCVLEACLWYPPKLKENSVTRWRLCLANSTKGWTQPAFWRILSHMCQNAFASVSSVCSDCAGNMRRRRGREEMKRKLVRTLAVIKTSTCWDLNWMCSDHPRVLPSCPPPPFEQGS